MQNENRKVLESNIVRVQNHSLQYQFKKCMVLLFSYHKVEESKFILWSFDLKKCHLR